MSANKVIHRGEGSARIFDNRTLRNDYRTLVPALRKGMHVLDVGCGTGAISKDIAELVSPGTVTGIDNTEKFIASGRETYGTYVNLALHHADLFTFKPDHQFDLVTAARVLQWLNNPAEALVAMKGLLTPGGILSVLDYNHEAIEWDPAPPDSMQAFYDAFLRWRAEAGMNNRIAADLPDLFHAAGLQYVETFQADEHTHRGLPDFKQRSSIWLKVAASSQMVDEGYTTDELRLQAIREYEQWVEHDGRSMTLKLAETRGKR